MVSPRPYLLFAACAALALAACAGPKPHVHFASATPQQLAAASEQETWFEFHPGDEVPLQFLYKGVVEAATPVKATAKRQFWLVFQPNAPPMFSFDGKSVTASGGKAGMLVGRDGETNFVGVVTYIGKPEDAPPELR